MRVVLANWSVGGADRSAIVYSSLNYAVERLAVKQRYFKPKTLIVQGQLSSGMRNRVTTYYELIQARAEYLEIALGSRACLSEIPKN